MRTGFTVITGIVATNNSRSNSTQIEIRDFMLFPREILYAFNYRLLIKNINFFLETAQYKYKKQKKKRVVYQPQQPRLYP
jgi:hypothetical protein